MKGHECSGGEVDVAPDEEAVEGGEDAGQGHEEGGQREGYGRQPRPLIDQLTNNILVYQRIFFFVTIMFIQYILRCVASPLVILSLSHRLTDSLTYRPSSLTIMLPSGFQVNRIRQLRSHLRFWLLRSAYPIPFNSSLTLFPSSSERAHWTKMSMLTSPSVRERL